MLWGSRKCGAAVMAVTLCGRPCRIVRSALLQFHKSVMLSPSSELGKLFQQEVFSRADGILALVPSPY